MHFRYPVLTLLLTILIHTGAIAQGGKSNRSERPVITLRTNPFSILETDANVMLGIGVQWHPRWAATFEPAYVFTRLYDTEQESNITDGASGYKIRTDIRYYFNDYEFGKRGVFFVSPGFHYKYTVTNKWDDFGINCTNGQCDFNQRARYKEIKNETGAYLNFGVSLRGFGKRMGIELFGGLGAKFKDIREGGLPLGGSFINPPSSNDITFVPREGWVAMLPAGVKIAFRIGE
jgi:hypothetical protein